MFSNKITRFIILVSLFILSCGKEEPPLNVEEVLTSGTWVKHSFLLDQTNQYEEFAFKDEYNFFDNGKYTVAILVHYFNDNNEPVSEIVVTEDDWIYNKKTSIIDFRINDNPTENTLVTQFDWKVLEVSKSKIIVESIFPEQSSPIQYRIMLVKKTT